MIQGPSVNDPISAIPAAIKTKTSLLFGLWASAGGEVFNNELAALQNTIDQYCDQLDGLVAGISVGSEDLYRNSPVGQEAGENPGADPQTLVDYIARVRDTVRGSCLEKAPIGHVDTWTAYVNGTNNPVIEACDFIGMDAYPYFENTKDNPIENGAALFQSALDATRGAAGGKEVWITETGWPVSGKESGQAIASTKNAEAYYKAVGCPRFGGNVNIWWYTLQDSNTDPTQPSFGVVGTPLSDNTLYDLSCANVEDDPATSSSKSSSGTSTAAVNDPVEEATTTAPVEVGRPEFTTTARDDEAVATTTAVETTLTTIVSTRIESSSSPAETDGNGSSDDSAGQPTDQTTQDGQPGATGVNPPPVAGTESTTTDESGSSPTGESGEQVPPSSGSRLNSFGAAFIAVVVAFSML